MEIKQTLYLARRLLIEERYLALKNSASFTKRANAASDKSAYVMRYVNLSYAMTSISFMLFSLVLVVPSLLSHHIFTLSNIVLILYIYVLFINVSNSLLFFVSISINHILDPLRALPLDLPQNVIAVSWFIYTGSSSLFAVMPAVFIASAFYGNAYIALLGFIWSLFTMLLGYTIGSLLFIIFSRRILGKRTRSSIIIRNAGRVIFLIFVFVIFEIILYNADYVNIIVPNMAFPYSFVIPIINIPKTLFYADSLLKAFMGFSLSILYLLFIIFSFTKLNSIAFSRLVEPMRSSGRAEVNLERAEKIRKPYLSFFYKDIWLSSRKSQNLVLLIMPIFFVFPTVMSELLYSPEISVNPISLYNVLIAFVVVVSSFYSILFLVIEGNGISFLRSLPVSPKNVIAWKLPAPFLIFAAITSAMLITLSIKIRMTPIYYFLVFFDTILYFIISLFFNVRRLYSKIPASADTINFYSFGGQLAFMVTFFYSGLIVGFPDLLSFSLQYTYHLSYGLFFLLNTAIGISVGSILAYLYWFKKTMI
ncbi:hypothetical protein [Thermoplasma volcanium GSS1]|uniref:Permease n=1 Tax=Thermoplasma volcanium (strain ATCC 51530 / DSM 4299 / JCM 9571 / NBRC 15438 / GSS1) TaxID=273116 RepID=Q97CT0_THEVO|nr:permease [Thermoplasma volcanium]BAB59163.1 hypothetical protein [Thermoplasma volcanium GSS1]